jgi:putative tryptophan/tyrosine transport system substrate-binding protein
MTEAAPARVEFGQWAIEPCELHRVYPAVEGGVVASFAKPGGNFTGFTLWEYSIIGKMLEMLKEISPSTSRAALVYNPDNPGTVIIAGGAI